MCTETCSFVEDTPSDLPAPPLRLPFVTRSPTVCPARFSHHHDRVCDDRSRPVLLGAGQTPELARPGRRDGRLRSRAGRVRIQQWPR